MLGAREPPAQGGPLPLGAVDADILHQSRYINRAGKNLPAARRRTLEQAKAELRKQFGRE
jgi:hypothetical protein